jgi:uncharacterized protein (TIGR02646 family)
MRYIDPDAINAIQIPVGWTGDVAIARAEVAALANAHRADRNKMINKHAKKTWRKLKRLLARLNYNKCWYCDCRQTRSNNNIDHFRPKGAVYEVPAHPGYWWLAFELSNFRFSCTFCNARVEDEITGNVGGKQENFPLFGDYRQMGPNDAVGQEDPVLLDPTRDLDVGMLTWTIDGMPAPRYDKILNERWFEKAAKSIELYNLNHYQLVGQIKVIYIEMKLQIEDGDVYWQNISAGQHNFELPLGRVKRKLIGLTRREAECSAAANEFLSEFKDPVNRPWLEGIP